MEREQLNILACWKGGSQVIAGHVQLGEECLLSFLVLGFVDGHATGPVLVVLSRDTSLLLDLIQALLSLGLTVEHHANQVLLIGTWVDEAIAELQQGDGASCVAHGRQPALCLDVEAREGPIGDLLRQGYLVHSVEVVPYVQATVLTRQEEDAGSSGTPPSGADEGRVVGRLQHRAFQLFHPHLRTPVAHREEELHLTEV